MIVSKMIPTPKFWVCVGSVSANQSIPHKNTQLGHYNDCMYIIDGAAEVTNGTTTVPLVAGELADLTPLSGTDTTFNIGPNQTSWIAFNPKRLDQNLDVTLHNNTQLVEGPAIVYSMLNDITVNGTEVKSQQFARIDEGRTYEVVGNNNLYAVVR